VRTFRLSKSRITAGLQCGLRLWLSVHRPDCESYTEDAARRLSGGHQVGDVARTLFGDGVLIETDRGLSQAVRDTQSILAAPGDATIYEATFRHRGVLVRADVLQRRSGSYRMTEVKSATRLKEYHLQDIAIQAWVAEGSGVPLDMLSIAVVDDGFLYGGGGDYSGLLREIPVADQARPLMAKVPGWVRSFNDLLAGPLPAIRPGAQCRRPFDCPFFTYCHEDGGEGRRAKDAGGTDDGVGSVGRAGTRRPPRADPAEGRLDPAAAAFLATLPYPRAYLDFETVQFPVPVWLGTRPYQQLVFQWSCHIETRPGELEHHEFLDTSGVSPVRAAAEALLATLSDEGPIFVYHDFEKWRIVETAGMFPDLAPGLERIAGRLVDLLRLTRDHYEHPALNGSYSLKTVLPTIAPELDHSLLDGVSDGLAAQSAYHEAVHAGTTDERRRELRRQLREYCQRDTLALVHVARRLAG
jgi:hypothetical protein